jgi:two-component system, OmpR family, sensor histidine kinase KdpD
MLHTMIARLGRHGYILAVAAVALSTLVFYPGRDHFAKGQWAILYLLVVVLVAGLSGTRPAILAAVLAFFCWNYFFLPPYHALHVADTEDWLSLAAFLVAGVVMGAQTGRLREREARAVAREREAEAINRLSAYLVSEVSTATVADTLLTETVRLLGAGRAALFLPAEDGRLAVAAAVPADGPAAEGTVAATAAWCFANNAALGVPRTDGDDGGGGAARLVVGDPPPDDASIDRQGAYVPLQTATNAYGVLYVGAAAEAHRPDAFVALLASLANLVAAFLERQRLQAEVTRAEAEREADVLKASLLSSVSHELKTPLAALTATVSNLLETDTQWDEARTRAELEAIVADVTRLNNGVGSLLDLSRLEAGAWEPHRDVYDLDELIETALDTIPAVDRQRVDLRVPDDLRPISVDFEQWVRVLRNILENALVYSPADTRVTVAAADIGDQTEMWIEDAGPGIPPEERERVFEKFYRGRRMTGMAPSGTGLGLAIAREIVAAHGGTIGVTAAAAGGARFELSLPARDAATSDKEVRL